MKYLVVFDNRSGEKQIWKTYKSLGWAEKELSHLKKLFKGRPANPRIIISNKQEFQPFGIIFV